MSGVAEPNDLAAIIAARGRGRRLPLHHSQKAANVAFELDG
jgi:hypothetical protein